LWEFQLFLPDTVNVVIVAVAVFIQKPVALPVINVITHSSITKGNAKVSDTSFPDKFLSWERKDVIFGG
jgi:hypothetical protein